MLLISLKFTECCGSITEEIDRKTDEKGEGAGDGLMLILIYSSVVIGVSELRVSSEPGHTHASSYNM